MSVNRLIIYTNNECLQVQQAVNKKDQYLTAKSDIHINNFDLMYGEKKLLMDASLTINYGHRFVTLF